jgi:hypothetical protein
MRRRVKDDTGTVETLNFRSQTRKTKTTQMPQQRLCVHFTVQHFTCMMSCDALSWLIFLQQFGQENQQVNKPDF